MILEGIFETKFQGRFIGFFYPAILEKLKKGYPAISQFWKFTRLQITRLENLPGWGYPADNFYTAE